MENLSAKKEQLIEALMRNIGDAIIGLKEWLPEGAMVRKEVLRLEGRFREVNKQKVKGIISFENYQLACNRLRDDLLELIDGIGPTDLKVNKQGKGIKHKRGSVLYNIPKRMNVDTRYKCQIRIAFEEDMLIENIELGEDVKIQDIRISNVMTVELLDPTQNAPAFSIYTASEKEQFIDEDQFTEWAFYVTPLREGQFPLLLKVSIIEMINDKERKRDIVLEEQILIVSDEEKIPQPEESAFRASDYAFILADAGPDRAVAPVIAPASKAKFPKKLIGTGTFLATVLVFLWLNPLGSGLLGPGGGQIGGNVTDSLTEKPPTVIDSPKKPDPESQSYIKLLSVDSAKPIVITLPVYLGPSSRIVIRPPVDPESATPEIKFEYQYVKDDQGNRYRILRMMDGLLWTVENLIVNVEGSVCYDNQDNNCQRLYTLEAAQKACATLEGGNWKVPTEDDWGKMIKKYGGYYNIVTQKSLGNASKGFHTLTEENESGFKATLDGYGYESGTSTRFSAKDKEGYYWSTTETDPRNVWVFMFNTLGSERDYLEKRPISKTSSLSCRCVKE